MPYNTHDGRFELASPLGHVPTVEHPLVREFLARYEQAEPTLVVEVVEGLLVNPDALPGKERLIEWTISVDGSTHEHEIDPRFPLTRGIFLQIAGVIIDLERFAARVGPYADPVAMAEAQWHAVRPGFLPSSNLVAKRGASALDAFREEVYRFFRSTRLVADGLTMLDALLQTLAASPLPAEIEKCGACGADVGIEVAMATTTCPKFGAAIYALDFLRAHEAFDPHGSNLTAAGRVVSAAEHLAHVTFLLFQLLKPAADRSFVPVAASGALLLECLHGGVELLVCEWRFGLRGSVVGP